MLFSSKKCGAPWVLFFQYKIWHRFFANPFSTGHKYQHYVIHNSQCNAEAKDEIGILICLHYWRPNVNISIFRAQVTSLNLSSLMAFIAACYEINTTKTQWRCSNCFLFWFLSTIIKKKKVKKSDDSTIIL